MLTDDVVTGSLRLDAEKLRRFTRMTPSVISISQRQLPARLRVERFLEDAYGRAFGGRLRSHYPVLMGVWDAQGGLHAAAGFRFASDGPLFLEQYLDAPVEHAVAAVAGGRAERDGIAEIGNLASSSPGASIFLFLALAGYLDRQGCRWAVATATRQLRRIFGRAGFTTRKLAEARADALGPACSDWGSYYEQDPQVLAGEVGPSFGPLRRSLEAGPEACVPRFSRLHYRSDRAVP